MKDSSAVADLPITREAFRSLNEWVYIFGGNLRRAAIELGSAGGVSETVTIETVRRAVELACQKTAATASCSSDVTGPEDEAGRRVA